MIMAKPKPIQEIIGTIKDFKKVLVAGCNGCVAVCESGGLKEVQVLASALRIHYMSEGDPREIGEVSLTRQCDKEYLEEIKEKAPGYDAIVSIACGVGVQFMAEMYTTMPVLPGVDTTFMGVTEEQGVWSERCAGCGKCVLAETGGVCPIAMCAKRMLNGPCGGSEKGKCELSTVAGRDIPCAWHRIYERLKTLGQLHRFGTPTDVKDWLTSRDGGPRIMIREDVRP